MSDKIPAIETSEKYKKEILEKIENKPQTLKDGKAKTVSEIENKWNMNNRIIELFSKNIENDQNLKEKYAIILIGILTVQLITLIVIFILKGCGVLDYSDTTFNIFITGGIAEVFVLVKMIVQYLFTDNLTEALKIILRNNNQVKDEEKNGNNIKNDKTEEI